MKKNYLVEIINQGSQESYSYPDKASAMSFVLSKLSSQFVDKNQIMNNWNYQRTPITKDEQIVGYLQTWSYQQIQITIKPVL